MVVRTVTAKIKNTGDISYRFPVSLSIDGKISGKVTVPIEPQEIKEVSFAFDDSKMASGKHKATVTVWVDKVGGKKITDRSALFEVRHRISAEIISLTVR